MLTLLRYVSMAPDSSSRAECECVNVLNIGYNATFARVQEDYEEHPI
jgi:hypothetical protein